MSKKSFPETLELTVPSSTRHLHAVRTLTRSLAESMGFHHLESENAALAVEEALTNVIEHAYHGDANRKMQVVYELGEKQFTIRILHNGDQIDSSRLSGVDDLSHFQAQKKKGGLGIYLMKKCMDEVTYKKGPRMNECCMIKYLKKDES